MKPRTHCKHGHAWTPENVTDRGECRACVDVGVRKWYKANPERVREGIYRVTYNLTPEAYAAIFDRQEGRCICGLVFGTEINNRPEVDHDRVCCPGRKSCGKCIRGLLCGRCNRVLGWYEKRGDIHLLPVYLKDYSAMAVVRGSILV